MGRNKNEFTGDDVLRRIIELLKAEGKTEKDLERAIGLSTGAFVRWKYQNGKSYMKYISEISEFLNVTPEYLMSSNSGLITPENMTQSELILIKRYRKLNTPQKECIMNTVKLFAETCDQ